MDLQLKRKMLKMKERSIQKNMWPGRGGTKGGAAITDVLPEYESSEDEEQEVWRRYSTVLIWKNFALYVLYDRNSAQVDTTTVWCAEVDRFPPARAS